MDEEVGGPRSFAIPPASGDFDGIELSYLDPGDPDDRRLLIEAEHAELRQALKSGVSEIAGPNGSPMNPALHISLHELVANQLWDSDPPEVWATAQRLQGLGYERHEILHMLAGVAGEHLWTVLTERRAFERDRYVADLAALPGTWEAQRAQAPARRPRPLRRGKPKKRGGRRRK